MILLNPVLNCVHQLGVVPWAQHIAVYFGQARNNPAAPLPKFGNGPKGPFLRQESGIVVWSSISLGHQVRQVQAGFALVKGELASVSMGADKSKTVPPDWDPF